MTHDALVMGGTANITDVDETLRRVEAVAEECLVQLFDARYVAGEEHLLSALRKARRAFERGENISQDVRLEVMLYAAATRQLRNAFKMGIKPGSCRIAVLIEAENALELSKKVESALSLLRDDSVVECSPDKWDVLREFFHISDEELSCVGKERLCQLVLERVALLDVEK